MCNFFSGAVTRNFKVFTNKNSNNHESVIKANYLDDTIAWNDERRDWIRFELTPKDFSKDFFSSKRENWAFKVDEKGRPPWLSIVHEDACWEYLRKNILSKAWYKRAAKEMDRISKRQIKWFSPMLRPDERKLSPLAQRLGRALHIKGYIDVKLIELSDAASWDASEDAARAAAWDASRAVARAAAWDASRAAAWDAARAASRDIMFKIGKSKNRKYKTNPFKLMLDLWSQGFYCCGIVRNTLTLGYVPIEVQT